MIKLQWMEIYCRQQVSVMHRYIKLFSVILLFSAHLAHGKPTNPKESLKPYTALYESQIKGIDILFERQLSIQDNGNLLLTMRGEKFFFQVSEVSSFFQDGTTITPINYKYSFHGGITRKKEIQFNTSTGDINSLHKNKWFKLPKEKGVLDRLSVQEQLRLLLMTNVETPKRLNFRVADGSRIKNYTFLFLGEEILPTNIGDIKTIRFSREFESPDRLDDVWLAPDLDFLMVKHVHTENGNSNQASLLEFSIGNVGASKN